MMSMMPVVKEKHFCDTCIITKQCHASIPVKAKHRVAVPHDLLHDDLCKPIMSATPGDQWFFLPVNDATTYRWISLITTRSDVVSAVKKMKATTELGVGRPPWMLRLENSGEFMAMEFATYYVNEGR
jgi:hypothetical protein